jgi:hypothetical protein
MKLPRILLALGAVTIALAGGAWVFLSRTEAPATEVTLPPPVVYVPPTSDVATPPPATPVRPRPEKATSTIEQVASSTEALPAALRLDVPFLSQAPKKDWAMPYQEACEEASALMVQAYFAGKRTNFSPEEGDQAILAIVDWAAAQYGPELVDMTAAEVATMVEGYMPGLKATVKPLKSANDIKRELAKGFPVILPADGKRLENPRFRNGGPRYHMLVIKGYLEDGRWITNDPGTQFGENFLYSQQNLLDSARDWNGGDVPNGASVMLVVEPVSAKR